MTANTTDIRGRVIDGLCDALRAHPELIRVQVEPEDPGDVLLPETVVLVDVSGIAVEVPTFGGPRTATDDRFRLRWEITVNDRPDYYTTRARVVAIANACRDVCVNDPDLGGMAGLIYVLPTNVNGPMVYRANELRIGRATVDMDAFVRIN